MTPRPADASAMWGIYDLLRYAATRKQPVAAAYDGQPRLLCPHIGGRKSGRLHVLCYQFGGSSNSAELLGPEGKGVWRCFGCGETQPSRGAHRGVVHRATLPKADLH